MGDGAIPEHSPFSIGPTALGALKVPSQMEHEKSCEQRDGGSMNTDITQKEIWN